MLCTLDASGVLFLLRLTFLEEVGFLYPHLGIEDGINSYLDAAKTKWYLPIIGRGIVIKRMNPVGMIFSGRPKGL